MWLGVYELFSAVGDPFLPARDLFTLQPKGVEIMRAKRRRMNEAGPCMCEHVELANGDESTSPVPTLFTVSPIKSILVSLFRHDWIIYGFAWELRKREREVAIVYILCGSTRCLLMFFLLRSTLLQFRTSHHVAVE